MTHDEQSRRPWAPMAVAMLAASAALLGSPAIASSEPLIQQGEKLTGAGELGGSWFAESVALSADGNTALIGGVGAAWVFTRSGSTWTQQGEKLTAAGGLGDFYFASVALSADGNTALIGGGGEKSGVAAAWVFTRSGSTWTQQGELTGTGEVGEAFFGGRLALSSDGNTALVGGLRDNEGQGAAWVFTRSGSTWTQQGEKLVGAGETGKAQFGGSVALSADGNTALIGGGDDNGYRGAAWVFTRSGSTWTQQGEKLTEGGMEFCCTDFGSAVALSEDGNTALIGGDGADASQGAAWVFARSGTTWSQQGSEITPCGEVGEAEFGDSVALSSQGSTALIGGARDNQDAGAAWTFAPGAASPPIVGRVSPKQGSTNGGTTVTITGTNLCGTAAVAFGGRAGYDFIVRSPTSVTVTSPSEPTGTVDVTVTGPGGTSVAGEPDRFTYVPYATPPSIAKVRPRRGPSAGGTKVKINGTNLGEASSVKFGSRSAASFKVVSATSVTAVSPPGLAGVVDVSVTTPEGVSATVRKAHFRYVG